MLEHMYNVITLRIQCNGKENYQKLIHVVEKKNKKKKNIWKNTKFLDLISKIHYHCEYLMIDFGK